MYSNCADQDQRVTAMPNRHLSNNTLQYQSGARTIAGAQIGAGGGGLSRPGPLTLTTALYIAVLVL